MDKKLIITQELLHAQDVLEKFIKDPVCIANVEAAADLLANSIKSGGKAISCGNGGSHCDAMHFAEELTGRFRDNRNPLPAVAISDPSYMSCVGNDYGFDYVFSRFVEGLATDKDVLLAISTSGNSKNVIHAIEAAKKKGAKVIALTGNGGGKMVGMADVEICVPHFGYADRVQEVHIKIIHILILLVEKLVA
ncbi:D-sedoheptulose 7-phosphate isomerase [Fulvivirga lutea]|uniref:Phosphoheptose isomerase n=1 Tax=Fulvivirga lutea TaxID=2810512 RepID=A0A974WJ67_9BACT|nr:D-sedoheptulose 7-phosphate isomerase [Fulvivirga lutea]QSE98914.1 D-sedoheptulose 7-phosphate isomerase [Fulvivirga lutea]